LVSAFDSFACMLFSCFSRIAPLCSSLPLFSC
jgi:hypothetical protein